MKKINVVLILIVLAGIIVFSFYQITGYIVEDRGDCIDSDNTSFYLTKNEPSFYTKAITKYENRDKIYEDYCVRAAKIKEYYCTHGGVLRSVKRGCAKGCVDGACVK